MINGHMLAKKTIQLHHFLRHMTRRYMKNWRHASVLLYCDGGCNYLVYEVYEEKYIIQCPSGLMEYYWCRKKYCNPIIVVNKS
jgi:hypothetical protein